MTLVYVNIILSHVIICSYAKILLVSSNKAAFTKYSDFFSPPPPPRQEFSGGDASVLRSSALKGLNCLICDKIRVPFKNMLAHVFVKLRKTLLKFLGGIFLFCV